MTLEIGFHSASRRTNLVGARSIKSRCQRKEDDFFSGVSGAASASGRGGEGMSHERGTSTTASVTLRPPMFPWDNWLQLGRHSTWPTVEETAQECIRESDALLPCDINEDCEQESAQECETPRPAPQAAAFGHRGGGGFHAGMVSWSRRVARPDFLGVAADQGDGPACARRNEKGQKN